MPLPQQVINQLTQEPSATPGWSSGVLVFCGGIFTVVIVIYLGMTFAYEPYLNGKLSNLQGQVRTLSQSVSSDDQTKLITFYSQISNLQSLLQHHVIFSQFLTWLENNTETGIYYTQFSFGSTGQITLTGDAPSEADINQQIAIFESSPQIQKVAVTNVGTSGTAGVSQFTLTILIDPSVVAPS